MNNRSKRQIFFKDANNHEMNEALRVIRTNLNFLNEKEVARTILITSTTPKEGKSTIASLCNEYSHHREKSTSYRL